MSYHQMIKDLLDKEPTPKPPPWSFPAAMQASLQGWHSQEIFFTAGGHPTQPPSYTPPLIYKENEPEQPEYKDPKEIPYMTLFELDGWQIERYEGAGPAELDWVSHPCPSFGWRYRIDQWGLMADGVCPSCCEPVPDEVFGVWKLKNWDKLPDEEAARYVQGTHIFPTSASERPWWM